MAEIRLLTKSGDYVVTVRVPPFVIPAEVIIWGDRCFVCQTDGQYREGLAYVATEVVGV